MVQPASGSGHSPGGTTETGLVRSGQKVLKVSPSVAEHLRIGRAAKPSGVGSVDPGRPHRPHLPDGTRRQSGRLDGPGSEWRDRPDQHEATGSARSPLYLDGSATPSCRTTATSDVSSPSGSASPWVS